MQTKLIAYGPRQSYKRENANATMFKLACLVSFADLVKLPLWIQEQMEPTLTDSMDLSVEVSQ